MITLGLLIPFIVNLAKLSITGGYGVGDDVIVEDADDDDDGKGGDKVRDSKYIYTCIKKMPKDRLRVTYNTVSRNLYFDLFGISVEIKQINCPSSMYDNLAIFELGRRGREEEPEGEDAGDAGDHAEGADGAGDAGAHPRVRRQRLQLQRPLPLLASLHRPRHRHSRPLLRPSQVGHVGRSVI